MHRKMACRDGRANRHWRALAVAALTTQLASCHHHEELPAEELRPVVLVGSAQSAAVADRILRGSVFPLARLRLGLRGGGVVKSVAVRKGDHVKKGQVLAAVEADGAEERLRVATVMFQRAKRDFASADALTRSGSSSMHERESARDALDIARAQLDEAREALLETRVVAPSNGTISSLPAKSGEAVGPGAPVVVLDEGSRLVVKVIATPRETDEIRVGETAVLVRDEDQRPLSARVTTVSTSPDVDTGLFDVELAPSDDAAHLLHVGDLVSARFVEVTQAPQIPATAVVDEGAGEGVFVVHVEDGRATVTFRKIEVGQIQGASVFVRGGLDAGDRFVLEGSMFLRDGEAVEIAR